jgi:hypothetical protein
MTNYKTAPERFADIARKFRALTTKATSNAPVQSPQDRAFADLDEDDWDAIAEQVARIASDALLYLDEAGYDTDSARSAVTATADGIASLRSARASAA